MCAVIIFFAFVFTLPLFALPLLESSLSSQVITVIGGFLIVIGALGGVYLWIGMLWYWARFDNSAEVTKLWWFLALFAFVPIGTAFYYFAVYRRALIKVHGLSPRRDEKSRVFVLVLVLLVLSGVFCVAASV